MKRHVFFLIAFIPGICNDIRINDLFAAWKFVKLMEVTVSPDPDDPHVAGSVPLVKDG